ncbi:MAG: HEAT repeat domain-containing protein [Pseudomonadota bacterium]
MRDEMDSPRSGAEISALQRFLDGENDVLRCAAVRALPRVTDDKTALRAALTSALLDPDADVRSEAMEALARVATLGDVPVILRSLEGDPVREVKLASIDALRQLPDETATELLRALVLSRSEDRVAWEDEGSDWEDWLDVQIAAIRALGDLGVTDAIDDMMAARDDEYGQQLDVPVFNALAAMGETGVSWLVAVISTEGGQAGQRAADVLARCAPYALRTYIDTLVGSEDARLRRLAVAQIAPDEALLEMLALKDADPGVRRVALERAAPVQPELAVRALRDSDASVQAIALETLSDPLPSEDREAILDNMLAWLRRGSPALMRAAATKLAELAPDRAEAELLALISDEQRPLGARVAAASALGMLIPPPTVNRVASLLSNPAQQVRSRLLGLLSDRVLAGDIEAQAILADAISGTLLSEEHAVREHSRERAGLDVALSKDDGGGSGRIRITRDGDIVEDEDLSSGADPQGSTLDSILATQLSGPELAEDTPEESAPKRRKRRAVEGPVAIAKALSLEAVQTTAAATVADLEAPILAQADTLTEEVRRAAWQCLARRVTPHSPSDDAPAAAQSAIGDPDPVVRLAAYQILLRKFAEEALVQRASRDEDALIRAEAVRVLPPDSALAHLADPVLAVRSAALEQLAIAERPDLAAAAFDRLVEAERSDTLSSLFSASAPATAYAFRTLTDASLPLRKALVILTALSQRERIA